jgi:hypothetical protein
VDWPVFKNRNIMETGLITIGLLPFIFMAAVITIIKITGFPEKKD